MPCRNAGPYLQAAVQSVLAQKECLELLVADGGSTDGSLQVLADLAAANSRLHIISRSDRGPADAKRLHNYALELQLGIAEKPEGADSATYLQQLFESARPSLSPAALAQLQSTWLSGDLPQPPQSEPCSWKSEALQPAAPRDVVPFAQRPFGVNLIGHAFEMFGIGEDIRMAARALQAADVPCCVIHHPAANGASCSDRSLEPLLCSDPAVGPYAFNLVCMAAPIQAR